MFSTLKFGVKPRNNITGVLQSGCARVKHKLRFVKNLACEKLKNNSLEWSDDRIFDRVFKVARNSFHHLYFDGSLQLLLITWCYNHGIKSFRKFKVALNPMYIIFLNFAKSYVLSCLSNVDDIKKISPCRFWIITP